MPKVSQKRNIIFLWIGWHYFEMSNNLLDAWKNFLVFNLNYFSIPLLLNTFFSPGRRYKWNYPRGFDIKQYFETFISNLVSRILGAICRVVLILIGIVSEIFVFLFGSVIFLIWLILPVLLLAGLWFGFNLLLL